jgi:RNA polymerase sigma factor (sigma-70 family)
MRTEDGHIIRECLNGDSASFGLLVDKYKASIYALAYSRLHNFHDAEDIAQDVFLKAYENLRTLRRWDSFLVWIRSIAINLCKNKVRTRSRLPDMESIEDQETQILEEASVDIYRDEQSSISHDEALSYLDKALESLPEAYQQVLTLHYLGGMSGEQMSQFLGISHANVRQRLSRARRQLREEVLAMMSSTYEGQRLQASFTFRIVEAVKRIKINPMPRIAGLPWGLSFAVGIIVAVLSLNPHMSITSDIVIPTGSPLPVEAKALKTGEIPVEILKTSEISVIASKHGADNGGATLKALMLAPQAEGGTWTQKADMPTAKWGLSTSVVDGIVYAIGGSFGETEVTAYNPATNEWAKKTSIPTGRMELATGVVNGKIYAIGGAGRPWPKPLAAVEEYDPAADTWTKKTDMPTPRGALSASVVDGIIYAIGGQDGAFKVYSTVEAYDPVTDTWTEKAHMPTPRSWLSTCVVDGIIYAIGGSPGVPNTIRSSDR